MKYKITLSQTANGQQEYLQIISADQFSTNLVLIGEFEVVDARPQTEEAPTPGAGVEHWKWHRDHPDEVCGYCGGTLQEKS